MTVASWDTPLDKTSPELPCGAHHGWEMTLLGTNQQGPSFEDSILGHDGVCDQSDYAPVAIGCWPMMVVIPMKAPWDLVGSAIPRYHVTSLRTSRTLRGRECQLLISFSSSSPLLLYLLLLSLLISQPKFPLYPQLVSKYWH